MSVSLALVPIALALRVVMGKERFEKFVDSLQLKIPTEFKDEKDLLVTVRKAGYDAERLGGAIKTHARGEEFFFFWQLVDGVWTAIFAKSDSQTDIKRFIRDLEEKAGRHIFKWQDDGQKRVVVLPTKTFPTNFRDAELLSTTLAEYGLNPHKTSDGAIVCRAEGCQLTFRQYSDEPFSVEIRNAPDARQAFQYLSDISDAYCHNVQARTYQNVKSRIADRGLVIEGEEVMADNSIVITLSIQR